MVENLVFMQEAVSIYYQKKLVRTPLLKSINSKIIVVSLILSLTALITFSVISFIAADNLLEERIKDQLLGESTGRGEAIRSLIDTRIQQIRFLATNNVILNLVSQLSQRHTNIAGKGIENIHTEFQNEIESFQKVLGSSATLENVKVISADGKVLLSTDPAEKGKDYSYSQKFKRGSIEPFLDFDLVNNKRVVVVTVPIIENTNDKTSSPHIGVVMATMDTRAFDQILLNRQGLGRTGEVYMANENKKMISESRFIKNAAFHQTVDTLPVRECFDRGINVGTVYNDYRNVPIVGFSYCAKDLGFVLHAEIDEAEIFQPITDLRNKIIGTSIEIGGIVIALAFYISRTISRPIIELRKAANRISKGDYNYQANIKTSDEIGQLAYQFDEMRKSVLETNLNLNKLVKERTKEITDMTNALDATAIVMVTDKNGQITKINRKFIEISRYPEEELIGQNPRILKSGYHPPEFFERMWKTITSGKIFEGEIKNKAKDGTYHWVKTTIVPFLDEKNKEPKQYIAIQNDITELKNYEYELQEALKRDRKSSEIIKIQLEELQKTNLELKRQDKLKDEFFSMISHELKTPLTPIIGWCGALKNARILGNITSEQRAAVDTIESNAVKLEKIISDMLDVQKLELNEMKFNIGDVNVDSIFNKIRKDFEFVMKEKNIQFIIRTEPNLKLKSDESRILQVFSALLYNSVDFVPKVGGKIELTAAESKSGNIIFCVKDNGPGIPKDKHEFLFKKFYQVDTSYKRKHGGTGLGLPISKGIVTALGGTIWVESEEGKGSNFYFSLPNNI
jgi:PAS domain S-box-containing protein